MTVACQRSLVAQASSVCAARSINKDTSFRPNRECVPPSVVKTVRFGLRPGNRCACTYVVFRERGPTLQTLLSAQSCRWTWSQRTTAPPNVALADLPINGGFVRVADLGVERGERLLPARNASAPLRPASR